MANSVPPFFDPPPAPRPVPVTPSVEQWRAMTLAEREQFMIDVNEALSDPVLLMSEGRPHKRAKSKALDMLGLHFRTLGKDVYWAEEMSVLYPGVAGFSPDVLAVLDVAEPEDDQRMAWVVADENKGLDWVLEVLWAGDRKKDLVENVEKYASLGIPEYFVYDQKNQRILGYRLIPESKRYQPILAQAGRYRSNVLGVDLAIVGTSLRFFSGAAELYDTEHLIQRLETMVSNLEERNEAQARELEQVRNEASEAKNEASEAKNEASEARNEVARIKRQNEKALLGMRKSLLRILGLQKVVISPDNVRRLEMCTDPDQLQTWLDRAIEAATEADVFGTENE